MPIGANHTHIELLCLRLLLENAVASTKALVEIITIDDSNLYRPNGGDAIKGLYRLTLLKG